jgi:membrane associated rhomboid family serine protease
VSSRPRLQLPRLTQVVKKLIIGLVVCYVLELIGLNVLGIDVKGLLALNPAAPMPWQLLSYVLVDRPDAPLFFLLGLMFLWWALSPFEQGFGPLRTVQLCLVAALGAALPAILLAQLIPTAFPLLGSQPLWFGAIAASVELSRGRQVSLFGMGSMTSQQFLALVVGISVLMYLASLNHTQLAADLGAMGAGLGFVRWMRRPRTPRQKPRPRGGPKLRVIEGEREDDKPTWLN